MNHISAEQQGRETAIPTLGPGPGESIVSSKIAPCVWLDDQAEQAAAFYVEAFPASRVVGMSHYPQSGDNPSGRPPGSVLTVELELAGLHLTLLNGGPMFQLNPSLSLFVHVDSAAEADRLFAKLVAGGEALMPLDRYPWSERYGWVKDRFGMTWQVMAGRRPASGATLVPCLMFVGAQHGRAEEAMRAWAAAFPGGRVDGVEHYTADEGPPGAVKHGRITLAGQDLVVMDSHGDHPFGFSEALSLQVMCEDQDEVDAFWTALADGGEEGPCGWLKDRFGFSWQVVPTQIVRWISSPDAAARDRAFQAMLPMTKLDIAALECAFEGR